MVKKPPTLMQALLMGGFVVSCLGLLIFLWLSFGGATPLRPESYRVTIPFDEGTQLADQADVRISGVPVGKVIKTDLDPATGLANAEVAIDAEFAPIPSNTKAILRAKTLLGETYVEITPGDPADGMLPEGATLPEAQVADVVQLDEILRTFDPGTRAAFSTWMIDSSEAIAGRGVSLSSSIAQLDHLFSGFDEVFRTLDTQEDAVDHLFADGSRVFATLSARESELSSLIRSSNELFRTTAARDEDIIAAFRAWPTFLDESQKTVARLREFSVNADPLVQQLTPAAEELSPTLRDVGVLAPEMDRFFRGLAPVVRRADRAFPAFRQLFRDKFPPLLESLDQRFLPDLVPLVEVISAYRDEITALMGNAASATNAVETNPTGGPKLKYLRALPSLGPESFATYPGRTSNSRTNAYNPPGAYTELAEGLRSYETRACGSAGINALLDPATPLDPAFSDRVGGDAADSEALFERIQKYGFDGAAGTGATPAPGCDQQPLIDPFGEDGDPTQYPQTYARP